LPTQIEVEESRQQTYSRLVSAVNEAAEASVPKQKLGNKHRPVSYWNDACTTAVKLRNAARHRAHRHRFREDAAEQHAEYVRLKGEAQSTIKQASRTHWEEYCSTLTSATKLGSVWRMAKRMSGTTTHAAMPNLVVGKDKDQKVFEANADKANLLAQTYANVCSDENYDANFLIHKARMEAEWCRLVPPPCGETAAAIDEPIGLVELRQAIEKSKRHSAPDPDSMSYDMVRHFPLSAQLYTLTLLNRIWSEGRLVDYWKEAVVVPIPKPGAVKSASLSYRPIALTSVL
jgi:hypothetical protein